MDELDAVMHSVDKWFDEGDPRLKNNPATRAADAREIALKAIEARAPEQGGEMREAIAFMKGAKWWEYHSTKGTMWQSDQALVAEEAARRYGYKLTHDDKARALLARESSEPILEEHDRWIDTDAIPPKPAEKRGPEVDALLWMAEHLMGSSVAMTMRGWLAEYRATGKLVVRDADGTVKDSLTVASKERQ